MPVLLTAGGLPVSALLAAAGGGVASLLQFAVVAGMVLAAADFFVVMRRNRKKTRMTKKEVKDENKSTEGDPLIKSQRRSRQLAMSRNRMIAAIAGRRRRPGQPDARRRGPQVRARQVRARAWWPRAPGTIAARIREEAEAKSVPMVQDIPLARALHAACELGQEIPVELYNAVARRPGLRHGAEGPRRRRRAAPMAPRCHSHGTLTTPQRRLEPASVKGPDMNRNFAKLAVPDRRRRHHPAAGRPGAGARCWTC